VTNLQDRVRLLETAPWKKEPFSKQTWGHSYHRIAPYVGRIKPAIAHWLLKLFSNEEDTVFDPFCGIGTIVLEADLQKRNAIGVDLNPLAIAVASAKLDRRTAENQITWIDSLDFTPCKSDLAELPNFVHEYYHKKTLCELVAIRDSCVEEGRDFLLGCLLGISHGHRDIHLSIRTGYIIPYIPKPRPPKVYKEVKTRLRRKAGLMHRDKPEPACKGTRIINCDTRKLPLDSGFVDLIISSPPYFDTLDYVHSNRLRLAVLGHGREEMEELSKGTIQQRQGYLTDMQTVGKELWRVLKKDGLCIFVLGDVRRGKGFINTAREVGQIFEEIGFAKICEVADEIPGSKTTIVKFGGRKAIDRKKQKHDRILVMRKN
jgi:methylase of polypeptide subunit release factors